MSERVRESSTPITPPSIRPDCYGEFANDVLLFHTRTIVIVRLVSIVCHSVNFKLSLGRGDFPVEKHAHVNIGIDIGVETF